MAKCIIVAKYIPQNSQTSADFSYSFFAEVCEFCGKQNAKNPDETIGILKTIYF